MKFSRCLTESEKAQIKELSQQVDDICRSPESLANANSFYRFSDDARGKIERIQLQKERIYKEAATAAQQNVASDAPRA